MDIWKLQKLTQNYKHAKSSDFQKILEKKRSLTKRRCFCFRRRPTGKFEKLLSQALRKGKVFGSDQIALNMTVIDQLPLEILPAYCN